MQTHTFKWKLFDVEYSSVKLSDIPKNSIRLEADFFEYTFLSKDIAISSKKYSTLWKEASKIDSWPAYSSEKIFNFNVNNTIPIVKIWDVTNKRGVDILDFVAIDEVKKFWNKYYKQWEILISMTWDPWNIWWVNMYFDLKWQTIVFNQRVCRVTFTNDLIKYYSYIFLNTEYARSQIERYAMWIRQRNASIYDIKSLKIPIPSQSFQEKIESLVIESYKQKELSEKLYKEAEILLLTELDLIDYKPKTKNINLVDWYSIEVQENHSTINYSILKELDRFDAEYWDYDFVEIKNRVKNIKSEKLWDLVKYKKWIEVWSEAYIEESEVEKTENKKYFVRISNFSTNWMTFNNAKFIKNDNFEILKDYQPQKWEILFSKDWTAWITYLLREDIDWIISGWILRFQNISSIPSEYIELVLNSILIQKEIERQTNGALIQHLKITDTLNFDIPLIWDDKIEIITEKIKQSFESKTKSKNLLEIAKKAVEIYIEEDENIWLEFIKNNY